MSKNFIGDEGLVTFAEAAEKVPTKINLTKIDISSSKISDVGIVKLVQILDYLP